jgi:hypothetical protein
MGADSHLNAAREKARREGGAPVISGCVSGKESIYEFQT